MKTIGIIQPSYLPWLNFFYRANMSDIFVLLDDVQYSKNSSLNRNQIKMKENKIYLTVPIINKNVLNLNINKVKIDNTKKWKKKHIETIKNAYKKSKNFNLFFHELAKLYEKKYDYLIEINLELIKFLFKNLKINKKIYLSSDLNIKSKNNNKLIDICKKFNGTHFIIKPNTLHYHPKEIFLENSIKFKEIIYKDYKYKQINDHFISNLSAIDYLFNVDIEKYKI